MFLFTVKVNYLYASIVPFNSEILVKYLYLFIRNFVVMLFNGNVKNCLSYMNKHFNYTHKILKLH